MPDLAQLMLRARDSENRLWCAVDGSFVWTNISSSSSSFLLAPHTLPPFNESKKISSKIILQSKRSKRTTFERTIYVFSRLEAIL